MKLKCSKWKCDDNENPPESLLQWNLYDNSCTDLSSCHWIKSQTDYSKSCVTEAQNKSYAVS